MLFAKETLEKKGYPFELADHLNAGDADSLLKCIEALDREVARKVQDHVNTHFFKGQVLGAAGTQKPSADIRRAMGL